MATKRPIDRGQKAKQRGPEMARGGYTSWKHLTCCHVSRISTSLNCLVNWMNGMRASFSLSLENQKSICLEAQAGGYKCHHPPLDLGHLFAGSREPGLTLSPSYTRPLQNSKAATLGVKPTHLLCISVEGVAGSTTTTPPFHHHHSTHHSTLLTFSTYLHHGQ
jgi:hypothetical protein